MPYPGEALSSNRRFSERVDWSNEMPTPDPRLLLELNDKNPTQLLDQLTLRIAKRMRRKYPWLCSRRAKVGHKVINCDGFIDPAEIAVDAIYAGLHGTGLGGRGKRRRWDATRETAEEYLWDIASSFLYHQAQRFKKRCGDEYLAIREAPPDASAVEKPAVSAELSQRIRDSLRGRPEFAPALEYLLEESCTLATIANKHHLSVTTLHRRVQEFVPVLEQLLAAWKS